MTDDKNSHRGRACPGGFFRVASRAGTRAAL